MWLRWDLHYYAVQSTLFCIPPCRGTDVLLGEQAIQQRAAQDKILRLFPRSVIRFVWSDDVVIQACFSPLEPVSALYDCIREKLIDPKTPFYLCKVSSL